MNAHVPAKLVATALSLVMVVFSVGAPFAQAEFETAEVAQTTTETHEESSESVDEYIDEHSEDESTSESKEEEELETKASEEDMPEEDDVQETEAVFVAEDKTDSFQWAPSEKTSFSIKRCKDFGYDFDIAKAELDGGYHFEFVKSGYSVSVNGDANSAQWSAGTHIAGVLAKAATSYAELTGGTSGTVSKSDIGSGKHGISHILWCGYEAEETPEPVCELSADPMVIDRGQSVTLTWSSSAVDSAIINNGVGVVDPNGSIDVSPLETTTYTFTGQGADETVHCPVTIEVEQPSEKMCQLVIEKVVDRTSATVGETLTYTIDIENVGTADCTGGGVRVVDHLDSRLSFVDASFTDNISGGYLTEPLYTNGSVLFNAHTLTPGETGSMSIIAKVNTPQQCGDFEIPNQAKTTARELDNFNTWVYSNIVKTTIDNDCEVPGPQCDSFTVTPDSFTNGVGGEVALNWETTNIESVVIDQGIGVVSEDGSTTASVTGNTLFTLTASGAGSTVQCQAEVVVTEPNVPVCESFTATPNKFTNGTGGEVTLNWETTNVDSVSIDNSIGIVAEDGATTTNVSADTTFVLTATVGNNSVTCPAVVTVEQPEEPSLSCDSFSASPTSLPRGGGNVNLVWSTTGATQVSINNGVGNVSLDGDTTVAVDEDTLFTLTVADLDGNTVQCDASVNVATGGGGGGGSSSPRCELEISDRRVKAGEKVTITWDNVRTNEMVIEDNRGNIIVDTEEDSSIDEDEGSIVVRPTRDTEYSMTVTRGSRDRVCRVEVEIEDEVTVIETRTQEPQVAGIALASVPYTGFEAGPFLTFIFYALLALWAAIIAYFLVVRERSVLGVSLTGSQSTSATTQSWEELVDEMHAKVAPTIEPETPVVASTATADEGVISPQADVPSNLPTGESPVFGYAALNEQLTPMAEEELDPMTELENAAHAAQALLSSDALNYFMDTYTDATERITALQALVADAKGTYPTESGWLVLNLERVRELATPVATAKTVHFTPETRVGASSLAEAMVSGNVTAAYDMIGNRPMFALADAAADLDAVYRTRKGMAASASDLLTEKAAVLSDEQIVEMIAALTSALDGTYDNEEAAVKMAIMKAIKVAG